MATLQVVSDYVNFARVLTQDTAVPYRYPDADFVLALSAGILESRRLRPDMWTGVTALPSFANNDSTPVAVDQQYALSFVYFMCGLAQLRDEEETQDTRAAAFMALFKSILTAAV